MAARPTVLLTGFGPFPGVPVNASARLIAAAAQKLRRALPGWTIATAALPTEWANGPAALDAALAATKPVLAIHVGVSRKAHGFAIEKCAHNCAIPAPDAAGLTPAAGCLETGGPAMRSSTLPAGLIAARLRSLGLPAELSRDAGGYLCNAVLYRSLTRAATGASGHRALFVHIPASLVPAGHGRHAPRGLSGLGWDEAVAGLVEIVTFAASLPRAGTPAELTA